LFWAASTCSDGAVKYSEKVDFRREIDFQPVLFFVVFDRLEANPTVGVRVTKTAEQNLGDYYRFDPLVAMVLDE